MQRRLAGIVFIILAVSAWAVEPLRVAGVQLAISPEIYRNEETFREFAAERIERVLRGGPVDLIVFPEYTGVFFAFFDLPLRERGITSLSEGAAWLRRVKGYPNLKSFFLNPALAETAHRIWSSLAREYRVALVGGSFFATVSREQGKELRNRTVVYDSSGQKLYRQDKVYLTPFERELLGLSPGKLSAARTVLVKGRRIALTLCRDTFFSSWETRFKEADLWIDIKANGEAYSLETVELFRRALPARIKNSPVEYGMTVCLNGEFLDLFWEGPSSVVASTEAGEIVYLDRAATIRGPELVRLELQ